MIQCKHVIGHLCEKQGSKRTFDIFAFGKDTIELAKVSDHAYYWSYNIKSNACAHFFILCAVSEKCGFKHFMPSHEYTYCSIKGTP